MTINDVPYGVHRLSYEAFVAPIPTGLLVCHKCDVKHCLNPDHLFVGTDADNLADMRKKKRHAYGERHQYAKLNAHAVRYIRENYKFRDPRNNFKALAAKFGVHWLVVREAYIKKTWKHVS